MILISKFVRLVLVAGCLSGVLAEPAAAVEKITPALTKDVEKIIREYLIENPEVIVKALDAYRRKQELAADAAIRRTLVERKADIRRDPGSPVGGNPHGDVVLVEFFDYRCGVCKRVHPIVTELVESDRKIRMVYKEWPILGPESVYAARAALAARKQGKYLVFHNALMAASGGLTPSSIITQAAQVGLNVKQLQSDMEQPEIDAVLKRNFELAEALKLKGTPSFVIGDELVRGGRDLNNLRMIVAHQRKSG